MQVVYFELNNWFSGRDYPNSEPFLTWIAESRFIDEEWVKENNLVVMWGPLDMSVNYLITAPLEWVEENCPDIISDKDYTYNTIQYQNGKESIKEYTKKYSDFLKYPEDDEELPYGRHDVQFLEYTEKNIGVHWINFDDPYGEYVDAEEDDD